MPLPFFLNSGAVAIKGDWQPTQQPNEKFFEKGKGWTTVEVWLSPTEDGAMGVAQDYVNKGYTEVRVSSIQPGVWRIEASTPGQGDGDPPDDPIDEWVLDSAVDVKPVESHPLFGATISPDEKAEIKNAVAQGDEMPTISAGAQALGLKLYNLLAHGRETYYTEEPLLRHSQVVATFNEVNFSMVGILNVFSTAGLPSGITPAVLAAINTITFGPVIAGFTQGWLKMPTIVRQSVFTRAEIVEEWRFGYWSLDLYA